ncbi:hypothetical protein CMV_020402 [Castanea mollissima]|uniref:Uncharacterized protein n=1 Tax=Castanea mollissima TaxID=60419 RepID=A0A8J4QN82_9ROSI|nr:hypothetical protein CMV_020402 [Castanea mollissima]
MRTDQLRLDSTHFQNYVGLVGDQVASMGMENASSSSTVQWKYDAFVKHEEKEEKTRVDKWRDALSQVGNLAGWHLNNTRPESQVIQDIVVWMHDLLGEMGKNMVRQECLDDPGKRSRLWDYEDINKVLKKNKGTETLKAMDIVKSLPSSFQLDELVQLCLQQSKIQQLWKGIKNFDKLKFIDLTDSVDLFITPDFTGVPNLEKLVLVRCTNLPWLDILEVAVACFRSKVVNYQTSLTLLFLKFTFLKVAFQKVAKASQYFLLKCWIKVNGFESASPIRSSFKANYGRVSSRHLWRLYLSHRYFDSQWGENFRQIDGNGSNEIEIRIDTSNKVEKVGIHYDIINDSASKGTQNKRSHDEGDGAGPFGEGYSIDEPPLKRRKFWTALFDKIKRQKWNEIMRQGWDKTKSQGWDELRELRGFRVVLTRSFAGMPMAIRWERLGQGKLKLNIGGSAQRKSGLAGGGGVLRDDQGNWVLGYSRKIGRTTRFLAAWRALRDGLHLCLSKNHLDVEVELDAEIFAYALATTQQSDQPVSPLMDDLMDHSIDRFEELEKRSGNFNTLALKKM